MREISRREILRSSVAAGIGASGLLTSQSGAAQSASRSLNAQSGLAYDDGYVYAFDSGQIVKYDFDSGNVDRQFNAPSGGASGLAYGAGSLWYTDNNTVQYSGEVLELDPNTGDVRSQFPTTYDPVGLAFGGGSLWVIDITLNNIIEYTISGNEVSSFDTRGPTGVTCAAGLAYFDGTLWMGTCNEKPLYKFDSDGNYLGSVGQPREYTGLATTDTELLGPDSDGDLTVLRTLQGSTPSSGTDLRTISYGETKSGELDASDPTGYYGYYEPVTFDGSAGDVVTITMTSAGDPRLILLDPNRNEVASNDDHPSLTDYNSRIQEFTLQSTGEYTIIATSWADSAQFEYELTAELVSQSVQQVTGQVFDPQGDPVEDALVRVPLGSGEVTDETDFQGEFTLDFTGITTPDTVTLFVEKAGFVVKSLNVDSGSDVDVYLSLSDETTVQISSEIHHLGDGQYDGNINSQFQEPVEGQTWDTDFQLSTAQAAATDATLSMTVRGAQFQNPVRINGTEIGDVDVSDPSGAASEFTLSVPTNLIQAGTNEIQIEAGENPSNPSDIDDFEISNIQLSLTLPSTSGDFQVVFGSGEVSIAPGTTTDVTVELENSGVTNPSGSSIVIDSIPGQAEIVDVDTSGTVLDQGDGLDEGEAVTFGFNTDPPAPGESVSVTLSVRVPNSTPTGSLGELALSGDFNASNSPPAQSESVPVTVEAGIPSNPTTQDVLEIITAYNSNTPYNGINLTTRDVLRVITAYNS